MYAIVKAGGHQEKVEVGDVILVNRLDAKKGDTVEWRQGHPCRRRSGQGVRQG